MPLHPVFLPTWKSSEESDMQEYFYRLADHLTSLLQSQEIYTCSFDAEESDFVRFNRSAVRQAGSVTQRALSVNLIDGQRHTYGGVSLSGDWEEDSAHLSALVTNLRGQLPYLPEDPHLLYATEVQSSEHLGENRLPEDTKVIVASILDAGRGRDLVGIYAAGGIHDGFANSFGQRNWFSSYSYNFDWSFYHQGDKAVKCAYAGMVWNPSEFAHKVATATEQLAVLTQPPRTIAPGRYRV